MLMSLKEDRSVRAQILSWSLGGRAKHHTFKKRLLSAKARKTSFIKPVDLKLFQEGKKKFKPDVQQQPELDPTSREFRWEALGPTDVEIDCWGPILMPFASLWTSNKPCWIFLYISLAVLMKASSTLQAVLAEVSMNISPCSLAKASPSSLFTSLRDSRSLLFPMSMITMLELECCRASSNHEVRWLKVSRLQQKNVECGSETHFKRPKQLQVYRKRGEAICVKKNIREVIPS